ncbi:exported protein of unknown function [Candidatus Nitrosocosmicus franklandus]|uniref:Uncharacterized protein n=1 Tax=Candidatus Nitrosocosmicus franklandianus TaxID=1798806 RepID=A0A484IEZ6_9ARCH|nr:exported protein of unknown function [Candidatus Nitrosocosmicus franklandus]
MIMFVLSASLFLSASLITVNAQILPQNNDSTTAQSSLASIDNPYGLRITDPAKDEIVFIDGTNYFDSDGKKLTLSGFSVADNGNLTGCDVSVITNNAFPYQSANATGPQGDKDFSKWSYTFSSNYANLHEGSNKITSKLTCESGQARAHYSINVTGVIFNGTFPQSQKPEGVETGTLSVEILSPKNGETVNIDSPITINGSSSYPQDYDCEVLLATGNPDAEVIAPTSSNNSNFKKTLAKGMNGSGDYRNWSLVVEPGTTNLKNGSQSLTAKLQCYSPLSAVKLAKVNVVAALPQLDLSVLSVEILSPKNGETVNIDSPITINGSSSYPQDYDCEVLLAAGSSAERIAPTSSNNSNFKKTLAKGMNGSGDYRNWSLVVEPGTTNLKNGSQSLTAKLQCYSPLSAVKLAKVNVVAILPPPAELKTMDVSIDKIGQGLNQRIIIGANDATTDDALEGTTITGSINDQKFSGSTDADGKYSTSIPTNLLESGDTITVSTTVTKEGYKLKKTSTSFEGTPINAETGTATPSPSAEGDEAKSEADLADRIFEDVQKQLSDQGINIPLPFG